MRVFHVSVCLLIVVALTGICCPGASASELQSVSEELGQYIDGEGSTCVRTILELPARMLPSGISSLFIIEWPRESQVLRLIGRGKDKTLYDLGALEYTGSVNMAKTDVYYEAKEGLVHVCSQMPFSAAYSGATYRWDRENLKMELVSEESGDLSAEALKEAEALLARGRMKEAGEKLRNMLYPTHYYNQNEMAVKFLKKAHSIAVEDFRNGSNTSWQLISDALDPFDYLEGRRWIFGFKSAADFRKSDFSSFIEYEEFVTLVNDYGFLLEQAGRLKDAIFVLDYVLVLSPDRTPAHLNLADALYKSGSRREARAHYRRYIELMTQEGKEKLVPSRAGERK